MRWVQVLRTARTHLPYSLSCLKPSCLSPCLLVPRTHGVTVGAFIDAQLQHEALSPSQCVQASFKKLRLLQVT